MLARTVLALLPANLRRKRLNVYTAGRDLSFVIVEKQKRICSKGPCRRRGKRTKLIDGRCVFFSPRDWKYQSGSGRALNCMEKRFFFGDLLLFSRGVIGCNVRTGGVLCGTSDFYICLCVLIVDWVARGQGKTKHGFISSR